MGTLQDSAESRLSIHEVPEKISRIFFGKPEVKHFFKKHHIVFVIYRRITTLPFRVRMVLLRRQPTIKIMILDTITTE